MRITIYALSIKKITRIADFLLAAVFVLAVLVGIFTPDEWTPLAIILVGTQLTLAIIMFALLYLAAKLRKTRRSCL